MGVLRTNASGGGRILELENQVASIQTQASNVAFGCIGPLGVSADVIYSDSKNKYTINFNGTFNDTSDFITNELVGNFRVITFKKDCFMRLKFPQNIRCTSITYGVSGTFKVLCQNDVLASFYVTSSNNAGYVNIPEQLRHMKTGDTIKVGIEGFFASDVRRVTFSSSLTGSLYLMDEINFD